MYAQRDTKLTLLSGGGGRGRRRPPAALECRKIVIPKLFELSFHTKYRCAVTVRRIKNCSCFCFSFTLRKCLMCVMGLRPWLVTIYVLYNIDLHTQMIYFDNNSLPSFAH